MMEVYMKLSKRPIFKKLAVKRTTVGLFSTVFNYLILYLLLCFHHTPELSTDWGMSFSFGVWRGDNWQLILLGAFVILSSSLNSAKSLLKREDVKCIYSTSDSVHDEEEEIKLVGELTKDEIIQTQTHSRFHDWCGDYI